MQRTPRLLLLTALAAFLAGPSRAQEPTGALAEHYGFAPLEIYKLDDRIGGLQAADLDGDGTDDLIVANNARSRIDLLLSGPGGDQPVDTPGVNQIPSDRRLKLRSLSVPHAVVSVRTGDFNGDGKTDLAYYGTPAEVVVRLNDGSASFAEPRRYRVEEAVGSPSALAVGDLNGDGRADLLLLREQEVVLLLQGEGGVMQDPQRLPHAASGPEQMALADLDGDGGQDLVLLDGDREAPLRVRFQLAGSGLGPEERLALERPRTLELADVVAGGGVELLSIEDRTGRIRVQGLGARTSNAEPLTRAAGRVLDYPLVRGDARGRALDVGDLDGDGRADVVVSSPSAAQLIVFLQGEGGLGPARSFPSLSGGRVVRLADLDGDGIREILVLSTTEKQLGLSVYQQGRVSFPTPLPVIGEPVALGTGDLDADGTPDVLYASGGDRGDRGPSFALRALKRDPSGAFVPLRWGDADAVPLEGLTGAPPELRVVDANGDGVPDVLVFNDYATPLLLLGRPGAAPVPAQGGPGALANATPVAVARAAAGKPGLLVAQNTYARQIQLNEAGRWEVRDQFNAARPSGQVVGVGMLDTDGDGVPEVALLDRAARALMWLKQRDGQYQPAGTLELGPLDIQGIHVADLNGDRRDDLLLAAADRFSVVLSGQTGRALTDVASLTPARSETYYAALVAGDFNADGHPDLAVTDTGEHRLELLALQSSPAPRLVPALGFRVFEAKAFRSRDERVEPRAMARGDFNGDGRLDLALIAHDRVLVYLQDPGPERDPGAAAAR